MEERDIANFTAKSIKIQIDRTEEWLLEARNEMGKLSTNGNWFVESIEEQSI